LPVRLPPQYAHPRHAALRPKLPPNVIAIGEAAKAVPACRVFASFCVACANLDSLGPWRPREAADREPQRGAPCSTRCCAALARTG
jgi:hypothetical protein